jgi:hypothetical protein
MKKRNTPKTAGAAIEPSAMTLDNRGVLHPSGRTATMLGVEESTLAAWRCAGTGPAFFKIGRRCFYADDDLKDWIAAQRREPASGAHEMRAAKAAASAAAE